MNEVAQKSKMVVCGSFRKFYGEIVEFINLLERLGFTVLSPAKSKIINPWDDYVILEADRHCESVFEIQNKHLEAIKEADFICIYDDPKGYLGETTAFEIGFALGLQKPVYALHPINHGHDILNFFVKVIDLKDLAEMSFLNSVPPISTSL